MNPPPTNPSANASPPSAAKLRKTSDVATRLLVIVIVCLVTLGALAIGIPWAAYRYNHVVVSEASVKGTITRVGSRIDGRIKKIEVQPGQIVRKGQVLLQMEDHHLRAALESAQAGLDSAYKDLKSEKMGIVQARKRLSNEIEKVNGSRKKSAAELEAQKSTLARHQKQYDRMLILVKAGAASQAELDKALADRDRAQAYVNAAMGSLEAAESNYQRAMIELDGLDVREARLGVLDSQIAVCKAKLAQAEADLEATVLRAPEDGRVLERKVEVGGSAKVGEPMISLWIGEAWVEAWVDERDLRKFKLGSLADVSFDATPDEKLPGRVIGIGLESDKQFQPTPVPATLHSFVRQNAMVPVRISLEEAHPEIQLGLSAVVGIRKQPGTEAAPPANRLSKVNDKP